MKRNRKYHGCGEEYNVEKKGKQCHFPCNIEEVEKISSGADMDMDMDMTIGSEKKETLKKMRKFAEKYKKPAEIHITHKSKSYKFYFNNSKGKNQNLFSIVKFWSDPDPRHS